MKIKEINNSCILILEQDDIHDYYTKTRFERCDLICIPTSYLISEEFAIEGILSCISISGIFFGDLYFYNNATDIESKLASLINNESND